MHEECGMGNRHRLSLGLSRDRRIFLPIRTSDIEAIKEDLLS